MSWREQDCADFVLGVLRREHGIELPVPSSASCRSDRQDDVLSAAEGFARRLEDGEVPCEKDVVLMHERNGENGLSWHIGVWRCGGKVMHKTFRHGVCTHTLHSLPGRGFDVEGIYRVF